ncbi:MAG: amino-acid N-acetyltransferase [Gammaproteobacteria bacterium]|jgi:amino-acid N-acetyltransferase|nr:amino-acid N-acetyltransferase [Gammaproteobacteria bacterium]MBT4494051.1 amino-acid N-acetyltransferase [Gammaproteobacteria bacterium]MBT7370953.1 amino-acid N-acetyltransferase [Gammaproteobacteria bacterium]
MAFNADHIKWFRDSSPYIDAHRSRTFVVCLPDCALESNNLNNIVSDIALLNSLGVKLVLVYGADQKVERALPGRWETAGSRRITTPEILETITSVLGNVTSDLIARFSASSPEAPLLRRDITTASGNYLRAKPLGVIDGLDHLQSGEVRRVNSNAITHQLEGGAIVLIPAIGYSPSGETFHLDTAAVASHVSRALIADKLIYMIEDEGLRDTRGQIINEIDLSHMERGQIEGNDEPDRLITLCDQACQRQVSRCHIISFETDGALLEELFTRDGCGTQIIGHSYEQIRTANIDDVPGILRLVEPLEASGVLVRRSRELLESEIEQFIVIERDGLLIGCAALYPFDKIGELACVVTHPDYRNSDRGDRLLDTIDSRARQAGIEQLFVLTTQSVDWFLEHGFKECDVAELPDEKRDFYNYQRNSRVLIRQVQ